MYTNSRVEEESPHMRKTTLQWRKASTFSLVEKGDNEGRTLQARKGSTISFRMGLGKVGKFSVGLFFPQERVR